MNELERTRADLDKQRKLTDRLWLAIAYLQQAVGVATGYCNNDKIPNDASNFYEPSQKADEILDEVVSLSPT